MRLWSLHPQYLDAKGLVALWREALLAQAVLAGQTRGYTRHPQLKRFLDAPTPMECIAFYLCAVHAEAVRRNYCFDAGKIGYCSTVEPLLVTRGQLDYEWAHLTGKLASRSPEGLARLQQVRQPEPHPLFKVVSGDVADWEVAAPGMRGT